MCIRDRLNTCINWCSQESGLFRTPEKLVLLNRGFFQKKLLKKSARVLLVFLTLFGGVQNTSKKGVFSCFLGVLLRVLIIRSCNSGFFREKLKVRARSDFRTLLVDRNRKSCMREIVGAPFT